MGILPGPTELSEQAVRNEPDSDFNQNYSKILQNSLGFSHPPA